MGKWAKILLGTLLAAVAAWAVPVLAAPGPETGTQSAPPALGVDCAPRPVAQLPPFFLLQSASPTARTAREAPAPAPSLAAAVQAPSMPGDVNEDGVVDMEDLLTVTANLGLPPFDHPRADVNGDGTVDVGDLVAVAVNLRHGALATPVLFPDANLEAAVREALRKPEGDITVQDLRGLTELVAWGSRTSAAWSTPSICGPSSSGSTRLATSTPWRPSLI